MGIWIFKTSQVSYISHNTATMINGKRANLDPIRSSTISSRTHWRFWLTCVPPENIFSFDDTDLSDSAGSVEMFFYMRVEDYSKYATTVMSCYSADGVLHFYFTWHINPNIFTICGVKEARKLLVVILKNSVHMVYIIIGWKVVDGLMCSSIGWKNTFFRMLIDYRVKKCSLATPACWFYPRRCMEMRRKTYQLPFPCTKLDQYCHVP